MNHLTSTWRWRLFLGCRLVLIHVGESAVAESYDAKVSIVAIGKKANDALSKNFEIISNQSPVYDDLTFANVAAIAEMLMEQFESKAFDKIEVVYNKFKNAATQEIMTEHFLPIVPLR